MTRDFSPLIKRVLAGVTLSITAVHENNQILHITIPFFLGSHEKMGLFSCEDNFHGSDFLQTMKTIWKQSLIKSFFQKFLTARESIYGIISTKISGLNAKAEIKVDEKIVQKIQKEHKLLGNLTFDFKVDDVEIVGKSINFDFDPNKFTKPDRICGNVTNDCQNIINFRNDLGGFHLQSTPLFFSKAVERLGTI